MKLADHHTRLALQRLSLTASRSSARAWAGVQDQEVERRKAGRARQRVLDDLPTYLERLENSATANGVQVQWADGAQDANRIVVELLRSLGAKEALRNRAPLLDEIALDQAAAANDIDLTRLHPGDHILTLADRPTSHPVWPAAHLRIEDISAAAQQHWGMPPTYDPDILASAIRVRLRRTLIRTRTAILGLNFAVADTGSMVCLDNDGHNASLVALARHAILLLSIEQVVANTGDLHHLIEAYSRSAWGHALPAYVTQLNRPVPPEIDGPRQIHLILVDNGRSRILDRGYGETLRCIHCGACHNACPVYRQIGGQGYGESPYSGPIGAVINPILLRPGLADGQPFLCTGCQACLPVCPVDIDLPGLLQQHRLELAPKIASSKEKIAFGLWRRLLHAPRLFIPALRRVRRRST
jgi:L-lactate dehydrogenase complex protein LldF